MRVMTLKRISFLPEATFGILFDEREPMWVTCERPWKDNQHDVSCIPEGEYVCRRFHSEHHGNTFEVTGVPNRSEILFHKGNIPGESKGCILVGKSFGYLANLLGILSSGEAMGEFLERLKADSEFKLVVQNVELA